MSLLSMAKEFALKVKKTDNEYAFTERKSDGQYACPFVAPNEREHPASSLVSSWNNEDKALIDWFLSADLPTSPFQLKQGAKVLEPQKFYSWLKQDIHNGPHSPRARYGALHCDLMLLKQMFQSMEGINDHAA